MCVSSYGNVFCLVLNRTEEAEIVDQQTNSRLPHLDGNSGKTETEHAYHQQIFDKNVYLPTSKAMNEAHATEGNILNHYRNQSNAFGVPTEIPTNYNRQQQHQQPQQNTDKRKENPSGNVRPASAIPEKVTISFGNTNNVSNLNDTMMSGLSSTGDYQKQSRPVSAPAIAKKDEGNNKSSSAAVNPGKTPPTSHNKAIMEAVYAQPYLKSAPLNGYQDTTQLPDRQYYNTHYHNLPNAMNNSNNMNATPSAKKENLFTTTSNSTSISPSNYNPQASNNAQNSSNGNHKKKSHQQQPAQSSSVVDRALSVSKQSQQILQERDQLFFPQQQPGNSSANHHNHNGNHQNNSKNRALKLNEMLEGNIVEKLDYLIAAPRR